MNKRDLYKADWIRCNTCRTRRTGIRLLTQHLLNHPECRPCNCGGYHFAHTPGSPYCDQNPRAAFRHALRRGETDEVLLDILVDIAWDTPGVASTEECPF